MDVTDRYNLPFAEDDDLIRNFPTLVSQLLASRVETAVANVEWLHGWIAAGDDLDNYLTRASAGVYPVVVTTAANLPVTRTGILEVLPTGSTVVQRFTAWIPNQPPEVYFRSVYNSQPTAWTPADRLRTSTISSGHVDDYRSPDKAGTYRVTNGLLAGLPVAAVGILEALPMSSSNVLRYTAWYGHNTPRMFVSTSGTNGNSEWLDLSAGGSNVTIEQGVRTSRGVIAHDKALAVFQARVSRHAEEPIPIVFAGSSTTVGNGATTPANRYVNRLVSVLQDKYPSGTTESTVQARSDTDFTPNTGPGVHGYNIGRGGTNAETYLLDTDDPGIAALNPAMILHMIGSNDYAQRRPLSTYKADLEHRIANLSALIESPHVHVLAHAYERIDVTNPNPNWAGYGQVLREIAEENDTTVAYIDVSEAFEATGIKAGDPFDFIGPDDVHSTDPGHKYLSDTLLIGLSER